MSEDRLAQDADQPIVQLREAVDELQILNEILTAVSTERSVERINRLILSKCLSHFEVEQGVIHLLSPTDASSLLKTAVGTKTGRRLMRDGGGMPLRLEIDVVGRIAHDKKPLLSNDFRHDDRFCGSRDTMAGIQSVLAVPLMVRDSVIGVLTLFNKRDDRPFSKRDQRVLSMIALPVAQVIESTRLFELEEDLQAAQTVQQHLLPKCVPSIPGVDLSGFSLPAKNVGGDYYDWLALPQGRLGCIVADVSGKGLPAALLMAEVQGAFRALAHSSHSPQEVMNGLARFLGDRLSPDRFITLVYIIVDPTRDLLTYASAGHDFPYLIHGNGALEQLVSNGMLLCCACTRPYVETSLPFGPGESLVVYTDGVTDARNAEDRPWGREGLTALLQEAAIDTADGVAKRIKVALTGHVAGSDPYDDMTVAVIRRTEVG